MIEKIKESIVLLDRWIEQNGWRGYDPYDIKGDHNYLCLYRSLLKSNSFSAKTLKMAIRYRSYLPFAGAETVI